MECLGHFAAILVVRDAVMVIRNEQKGITPEPQDESEMRRVRNETRQKRDEFEMSALQQHSIVEFFRDRNIEFRELRALRVRQVCSVPHD